jgi:enoyl-CoA hydratase
VCGESTELPTLRLGRCLSSTHIHDGRSSAPSRPCRLAIPVLSGEALPTSELSGRPVTPGSSWQPSDRRIEDGYFVETGQHVRRITIDRPDRMNSLSIALQDGLVSEFLAYSADPELRVLVLTATGTRAFCSGADLKEAHTRPDNRFKNPMDQPGRSLHEVVAETYKPTIAVLNGAAVGGGLELALSCDIRLATPEARLGLPEAKVGMGGIYGSVVLPRHVPVGIALEMMYTGEYITAEQAAHWGLVNQVHPAAELAAAGLALALKIAGNAPLTVRRMKETALKGLSMPVSAALRMNVGPNPYESEDREEGVRAFIEHRPAAWKGR